MFEFGKRFVQQQHVDAMSGRGNLQALQFHSGSASAAALGAACTCVINQDAAHLLTGDRKEMPAVLDFKGLGANQPQISFVNQGRGLQ